MASAWSRGEPVSAEEMLARFPAMGDEAAVRLIYEEVCLRRDAGQDVATTEVVNRYPRWKDELEVLLGCDRMLRPFSRIAMFPEAGEDLGPFRLLSELGRGASGKTYLAAEPALGDRLVVLKVLTDDQEEHLSLARLQHTHIIPLFSEQSFPDRGLRALCMPYLGGTSLARILEILADTPPPERRGEHILHVLDQVRGNAGAAPIVEGPYRRYLSSATYVEAICWIGACLADALQNAHTHALIHMDVKPSNVLIADDGLPMLLDFHLAHRPIARGERVPDRLGGTPGWMAPEHRAALDAVRRGEAVARSVDGRADIYSLGILLREALAGPGSNIQTNGADRHWRHQNPQVTVGLADIVDRCLAARAADRYPSAAALAEDLRRHLNELPLKGVANRSWPETWRKWRRRRPAALTRWAAQLTICTGMIVILLISQAFYSHKLQTIDAVLSDGRRLISDGHFQDAAATLHRGLEMAASVPATEHLRRSLKDQIAIARRGQKAAALHELADLVRFRYGIDLPAAGDARVLLASIQAVWNDRHLLIKPGQGNPDSHAEQAIRNDLLDLAIVTAELQIEPNATAKGSAGRHLAREILDLAETWCGPSRRLERVRRAADNASLDMNQPEIRREPALSALEHNDLGRIHLRAGEFETAAREFQCVLDERPQDFWPNFYQGLCAYRLGKLQEAMAAFRTCIALSPRSAESYFNRARVAEALGQNDQALRDYNRALELAPGLNAARINRGTLHYKQGHHAAAVADLSDAQASTTDSRTLGLIQYNLALAYLARGDRASAASRARSPGTRA